MLSRKLRKLIFLVISFFWVASDLFFPFSPLPAQSQTSVQQGCASMPTLCAELVDSAATKAALISDSTQAAIQTIRTKVVERGTGILLREVNLNSPFAAHLGVATATAAGITFLGLPSLDNARETAYSSWSTANPATAKKAGQVVGARYKIAYYKIGTSTRLAGHLGEYSGPVDFGVVSVSSDLIRAYARSGSDCHEEYYSPPVDFYLKAIRTDGTSEADDIAADPNGSTAPKNWSELSEAQKQSAVNGLTNNELQGMYSIAPVVGAPNPSANEDVYYQPTGTNDWIKLNNPTTQTNNIDTNGDGIPDLNITDGTGVAKFNIDTNGDGIPDLNIKQADGSILNQDTNGDGIADINIKQADGRIFNRDTNGDGIADVNIPKPGGGLLNEDTNGDGIADRNIDTNKDGIPDLNITDTTGNLLNEDTNGDGVADKNIDSNADGKADTYQPADGKLDSKTFTGAFFVSHAVEKLSQKFPFDIIGSPTQSTIINECPKYRFFDEDIELCILKDAFTAILIPFKIGIAVIFYQRI